MKRVVLNLAVALPLMAAGCGWEMKPKGFGATGEKQLDVLAEPDLGLAVVNNISPAQQPRFDAIQRPWEKVVLEAAKLTDAQKKSLGAIKDQWAKVPFGDVVKGDRYFYRAIIKTSVGSLDILFFESALPDQSRNFMARAKAGAFKGQVVTPTDGLLLFGAPTGKEAYTMKNRPMVQSPPEFTLVQMPAEDDVRLSGERFGICMQRQNRLTGKALMIGRISNVKPYLELEKMVTAHQSKPGSVVIEDVIVDPPTRNGLYLAGGEVQLPELDENGEPTDSTIAMFLGARGAPKGGASDGGKGGAVGKAPVGPKAPDAPKSAPNSGKPAEPPKK
ncbi:MAG TPA: hypothetical protein VNC50_12765 [Planctomycetia bacterium]|nr:hypothetical protein [Planctomycetia bacterium]